MKHSMPMYVRILLMLLLNVVVVVLLLGWVLKKNYGFEKDDLIANTVEGRMAGMVRLLIPALNGAEKSEWDDVLEQTGKSNGIELAIYRLDGSLRYAGSEKEVPEELKDFLAKQYPAPKGGREGPPRVRGNELDFEPRGGPLGGPPGGRRGGPPRGPRDGPPEDDFFESLGGDEPDMDLGGRLSEARAGMVDIIKVGKYGSPPTEMALAHFWIKPSEGKPSDLMLIVWKADSGSRLFFSWQPLLYSLVGLLLFTCLLWVPFFYRITRRLGILTRGAESISDGKFQIDVASNRGDELGRLSRSVQRMAARLDDYVTGQKRFLGDIAHELCSPLVRIRMGLGVLEHQMGKEEVAKLSNISEEVEELSQLVNELLDFSKASMKPNSLELEDVNVAELCRYTVSREGGTDSVHLDAPEHLVIKSREDLLRRAVGNLVRNALRYAGGKEGIQILVNESDDRVIIKVEDSGPGLPEDWLEKVFEPFSRPEDARTREGGGSGLGMAIAKTCITSLGGAIHCENRKQGGLRVVISLPIS